MTETDIAALYALAATAAAPLLNLPPFTPTAAPSWFQHVEGLFRLQAVTSPSTKADYVIEALPAEFCFQIADWMASKGAETILYDELKSEVILQCEPPPRVVPQQPPRACDQRTALTSLAENNLRKPPSRDDLDPAASALSLTSLAEPYATFISVLGETPEIADLHVTFSGNM